MSLRKKFVAFDDRLASLGVPPLTRWWRDGIGAWLDAYEAGGPLEIDACVGRGAGKSSALYKLALFFALFGDVSVPVGERHYAIVLSRLKEEASKGLVIIASWLRLLGEPHRLAGDVIELELLPRGIRMVAASVAATSGWRAFFVGKDERSKWPLSGVDERDAEEIDTSAAATTATHARAPIVSFGSAWGKTGSFYEAVRAGSNEHRVVLGPAATWIAAPHISEADTRKKEPNVERHAREYGAIASDPETAFLSGAVVEPCVRATPEIIPPVRGAYYVAGMDPASRANAWTLIIGRRVEVDQASTVEIALATQWQGSQSQPLSPAATLATIKNVVRPYGVSVIATDGHAYDANADLARMVGLRLERLSGSDLAGGYDALASLITSAQIDLPPVRLLVDDIKSIRKILTPTGYRIVLPQTADKRHADFAPSLALVVAQLASHVVDSEQARKRAYNARTIAALQASRARRMGLPIAQRHDRDQLLAMAMDHYNAMTKK